VYFGRLSAEKGLFTLLEAAKGLNIKVKIIGEGPLRPALEEKAVRDGVDNVLFLGYMSGEPLKEEIRKAVAVVLPSEWYENNPRTAIEAFALGKPVIGSRIGGIPELVRDGETGFTFEPGKIEALRERIIEIFRQPKATVEMGRAGRSFVERELNADKHYEGLMDIYKYAATKKGVRITTQ
jgi:glycosyltransferase involved in cell wall biosynthesis